MRCAILVEGEQRVCRSDRQSGAHFGGLPCFALIAEPQVVWHDEEAILHGHRTCGVFALVADDLHGERRRDLVDSFVELAAVDHLLGERIAPAIEANADAFDISGQQSQCGQRCRADGKAFACGGGRIAQAIEGVGSLSDDGRQADIAAIKWKIMSKSLS